MKTRIFSLTILLMLVFLGHSFAQNTPVPRQLLDLIHKSFDNYPQLKQGATNIRNSQEQHLLAKAGYLPTLDVEANYRYQQPTPYLSFPGFGSFNFLPANFYDFHAAATLPIWDFGRTQADVQRTMAQIQLAGDNLENAKLMLAYQVATLYVTVVYYNKSIEVQNEQIDVLKENEKIISGRIKDGDALKFDLLSTQVKRTTSENQLIDLQNNVKKDYEFLDMLTGQQGEGYITLDSISFNTAGYDNVTSDKSYDLLLLNDQLKQSEIDIKSARSNWLPKLIAKGQLGYQDGYVGFLNGESIPIEKLLLTGSVGVGLSIPIYGGDRTNYRIKIARLNVEAAKYNIETRKMDLDKNILQAKSDLAATGEKLRNYETQIDQAKEAMKLADIRYKAGVITNLEVLTAQSNLQDAELGKIQLEFQVLQSTLALNQIGGTKFW